MSAILSMEQCLLGLGLGLGLSPWLCNRDWASWHPRGPAPGMGECPTLSQATLCQWAFRAGLPGPHAALPTVFLLLHSPLKASRPWHHVTFTQATCFPLFPLAQFLLNKDHSTSSMQHEPGRRKEDQHSQGRETAKTQIRVMLQKWRWRAEAKHFLRKRTLDLTLGPVPDSLCQ